MVRLVGYSQRITNGPGQKNEENRSTDLKNFENEEIKTTNQFGIEPKPNQENQFRLKTKWFIGLG